MTTDDPTYAEKLNKVLGVISTLCVYGTAGNCSTARCFRCPIPATAEQAKRTRDICKAGADFQAQLNKNQQASA